jgi:hypothetical protein
VSGKAEAKTIWPCNRKISQPVALILDRPYDPCPDGPRQGPVIIDVGNHDADVPNGIRLGQWGLRDFFEKEQGVFPLEFQKAPGISITFPPVGNEAGSPRMHAHFPWHHARYPLERLINLPVACCDRTWYTAVCLEKALIPLGRPRRMSGHSGVLGPSAWLTADRQWPRARRPRRHSRSHLGRDRPRNSCCYRGPPCRPAA